MHMDGRKNESRADTILLAVCSVEMDSFMSAKNVQNANLRLVERTQK
jgi:hypothetical protein